MMETRDREKTIRSIFRPHTLEPIPLFIPLSRSSFETIDLLLEEHNDRFVCRSNRERVTRDVLRDEKCRNNWLETEERKKERKEGCAFIDLD